MVQRDLIKDQIEQMARALGVLLANFFGLKSEGKISQAIAMTNTALEKELDIDISLILQMNEEALFTYLDQSLLNKKHIDLLVSYLMEYAYFNRDQDQTHALKAYQSCLGMINWAQDQSSEYSYSASQIKASIDRAIEQIKSN